MIFGKSRRGGRQNVSFGEFSAAYILYSLLTSHLLNRHLRSQTCTHLQDGACSAVAVEGGGIDIVQPLAEMGRADDLYGTAAGQKRHDEVVGYA